MNLNPGHLFLYVDLPDDLKEECARVSESLDVSGERPAVDHVTLLYIPKDQKIEPEALTEALAAAEELAASYQPIPAKLQGWAYFDGAKEDKAALVGLIDAPGLADLHVDLKRAVKKLGVPLEETHGFTPHVTFAYTPVGERLTELPLFDGEFTIDNISASSDELHRFPMGNAVAEALLRRTVSGLLQERRRRGRRKADRASYKTSKSRKDWWVQGQDPERIDSYLRSMGMKS